MMMKLQQEVTYMLVQSKERKMKLKRKSIRYDNANDQSVKQESLSTTLSNIMWQKRGTKTSHPHINLFMAWPM